MADTALGIDVGAVSVKLALVAADGKMLRALEARHHGDLLKTVRDQLAALRQPTPRRLGVTGAMGRLVAETLGAKWVDFVQAETRVVRELFPGTRNIINIGGGSVAFIQLDEHGNFLDFTANSLCAAGTGAFLDQQAERLGISYQDMAGFNHRGSPPAIATRCSVFAKSDLIHRQQEGFGKDALWSGLCKGLTDTCLNTLLRGRPLRGMTVVTGGVSRNREVMRWLEARYGEQIRAFDESAWCGAWGAALLAQDGRVPAALAAPAAKTPAAARDSILGATRRKPLEFHRTKYPSFAVAEAYTDDRLNEARVSAWPDSPSIACYLGIDVGSTSTKLVLIGEDEKVICDIYRRTAGEPLEAAKKLFAAVSDLAREKHAEIRVLGAAATGSGRKLVGAVIGADAVRNEITAHLAGALHFDPEVDTIFEIGGQDSKYIRAQNGQIRDSNMNYVCAAGTGSFVEEQARKLGFNLDDIGDVVMGVAPPATSDRCTVFMEQDVDRLIRAGYSREECIAAVLCSVVKNYFTKVVGRRRHSRRKIFFQGATARNKGLVAAFENLLDVEMVVSPYCHVMGALGAALLAKREMRRTNAPSRFKGLDLSRRRINLETQRCELCANHCQITFADIEGETERPSWGYMCGREPNSQKVRVNREFAPFRQRLNLLFEGDSEPEHRRGTVVIPRMLHCYSMFPLWRAFFARLGYRARLTERTTEETIRRGVELTAADFCFPVKIAHGHAAAALETPEADFIFLPHVISAPHNPAASNSVLCPYVESFPSLMTSALRLRGKTDNRILKPVIDFACDARRLARELHQELGSRLGVSRAQVLRAWQMARREQSRHEQQRREEGRRALADIEAHGEPAVVILGRTYNTLDLGGNLALPQKIAELGVTVIPLDMLPYNIHCLNPVFRNMYWAYGQHILCAAEMVREHPLLFPIYFTNFSCGPDSFLLTFAEDLMGEKPMLTLELDEHGGDAGYLTRVEAFLDVVRSWKPRRIQPYRLPAPRETPEAFRDRRLWVPPMHPVTASLTAAALRGHGYDAVALPPEDHETCECGRGLTRGSECLPAVVTTGAIIKALSEQEPRAARGQALFMPTARGPCRFGQYGLLQRIVLNSRGFADSPILAPSSVNAYGGLSQEVRLAAWRGILAGDILWKLRCKIKPYEIHAGDTEHALERAARRMTKVFAARGPVEPALRACVAEFARVPVKDIGAKPLVGIVGEIYVRCNPFTNDRLIDYIERQGGEAWLTPISEWILYTAFIHRHVAAKQPLNIVERANAFFKNLFLAGHEDRFYRAAAPLLNDRREPEMREIIEYGARRLPVEFYGEAILTIGRAELFARQGAALIVNAAPFACMPGTITSALCREAQNETGVPIVSMFYDGEPGQNERLGVFFRNLAHRPRSAAAVREPLLTASRPNA